MHSLLFLNVEALIGALFWGNLTAFVFLLFYFWQSRQAKEHPITLYLMIAKLLHVCAYFCFYGRGVLPDLLSVNIGNTVFFIGFYCEAQAMFMLIKDQSKWAGRTLLGLVLGSVVVFNLMEVFLPANGIRVTVASLCVILIMLLPSLKMLFSRESSHFAKSAGLLNIIFLSLLLPRAWYGFMNQDVYILTSNAVQSLTFLSLLLLLIFSLPAYVLIIKEYTDAALVLMATTDRLTGATNRHAFLEAAEAICENHEQFRFPMSVLFIDIDHFKQVNDQYGHPFGDKVLTRLAAIIDKSLRKSDLSCRYGGEEFVVLLTHAGLETAKMVANRILYEVRGAVFEEEEDFSFTVSIGIYTSVPARQQTLDSFIQIADAALYEAKRLGRNQVVVSGEAAQTP